MTRTSTTCGVCTAPIDSGYACTECVNLLLDDLRRLLGRPGADGRRRHGLVVDVLVTASHQDVLPRMGPGSVPVQTRGEPLAVAAAPAPGRLDALDLHREIITAVRRVLTAVQQYGSARLAQHPDVVAMILDVSADGGLVTRAERLVDRPDGAFRIPCPTCGRRVGIDVDRPVITCRCGEWGTVDWWTTHVAPEVVDAESMNAKDGVLWLAVRHQIAVTECQIRQWAVRYPTRLARVGKDKSGRTLYEPGQLLTLARRMTGERIPS